MIRVSEKRRKATRKQGTKKAVEVMQASHQRHVSERVLYMWKIGPFRLELAHRASLAEGQSWSLSEIRHKGTSTTVLSLQHKSRGKRSSVLQKDDRGAWPGLRGRPRGRPKNYYKSVRPLSKVNPRV